MTIRFDLNNKVDDNPGELDLDEKTRVKKKFKR